MFKIKPLQDCLDPLGLLMSFSAVIVLVFKHGEVTSAGFFLLLLLLGVALKFLTYTPGLPCSSFQCEPLSVRLECIKFSIGNAVLKILTWLRVHTDRSPNSLPHDDLPSSQGHLVLCWRLK